MLVRGGLVVQESVNDFSVVLLHDNQSRDFQAIQLAQAWLLDALNQVGSFSLVYIFDLLQASGVWRRFHLLERFCDLLAPLHHGVGEQNLAFSGFYLRKQLFFFHLGFVLGDLLLVVAVEQLLESLLYHFFLQLSQPDFGLAFDLESSVS